MESYTQSSSTSTTIRNSASRIADAFKRIQPRITSTANSVTYIPYNENTESSVTFSLTPTRVTGRGLHK